mgnify:CR=1 FL=1
MLRRDYIVKLIQELGLSISRLLNTEKPKPEKQQEIEAMYNLFGADKDFFRSASNYEIFSTIVENLEIICGCRREDLTNAQISDVVDKLATLYYLDLLNSDLSGSQVVDVAQRALFSFECAQNLSDTYSAERLARIAELRKSLKLNCPQ